MSEAAEKFLGAFKDECENSRRKVTLFANGGEAILFGDSNGIQFTIEGKLYEPHLNERLNDAERMFLSEQVAS